MVEKNLVWIATEGEEKEIGGEEWVEEEQYITRSWSGTETLV